VLVVVNAGEAPARVRVHVPELAGRRLEDEPLPAAGGAEVVVAADGGAQVELAARSGRILRARPG
jgi:hypothetical protein